MIRPLSLMLFATLLPHGVATAQGKIAAPKPTPGTTSQQGDVFTLTGPYSVAESYPFGPGDRSVTLQIKLLSGENANSAEYWVLYSDDQPLLTGAHIGSDFPQGKAKVRTGSNGDLFADFIFPHSDHKTPNVTDVKPRIFNSGKTVYYQWVKKKGAATVESEIVKFTMPDKLTVVNFGDSYASGEGAPYATKPYWDDEKAHRSGNSGQARAVTQFKADHPGVAVAFKNVACSGAGATEGIIQSQKKKPFLQSDLHSTIIPPQVDQVRDWLKSQSYDTVNIALLSIGINEIGFGDLVSGYFVGLGDIAHDDLAHKNIDTAIRELGQDYEAVKNAFEDSFAYDYVLVSQYPDPTHGANGQLCGRAQDLLGYGACWGPVEVTSLNPEFEYAFSKGVGMNDRIDEVLKSASFKKAMGVWMHGGNAMEASKNHGLCNCADPWFNTIGQSLLSQGDVSGTWHPNREGHLKFVKPIILHDLEFIYGKIQREFSKERRKEIAIEAAKKKARAKRLAAQKPALAGSTHGMAALNKPIPPEVLEKAKEAAKSLPKGATATDNKVADDNEGKGM